jgi:hypothetical protein
MSNRGIDRRTFIAVGSAAIAGLAATPLVAQFPPAAVVSVGYRPFHSGRRAVRAATWSELVEASSLMSTEPSLMRTGARVSIRGKASRSAVTLDILHGADVVNGKVVFYAWTSESNGLSFNVPVEMEQTLDVAVTVNKTRELFAFTIANADGALKLNPGMYVFAIGEGTPSWSSLRMERDVLKTIDGGEVGFDYVVMTVSTPA